MASGAGMPKKRYCFGSPVNSHAGVLAVPPLLACEKGPHARGLLVCSGSPSAEACKTFKRSVSADK